MEKEKGHCSIGLGLLWSTTSQLKRPDPLEPFGPWDHNKGSQSLFPAGASSTDSDQPAVTHRTRRCRGARGHNGESDSGCGRVRCSPEEAGVGEMEDNDGSNSWSSAVKE
jgi:hypothetical protein